MIIWSGLGILIPVVWFLGMLVGSGVSEAFGQESLTLGIGLFVAALGNWGLWKLIYPKTPRVLFDRTTGEEVIIRPKHGLFFIPAKAWTWIMAVLAMPALLMGG